MVTVAENELLTRVERDAPMGKLLKEYWAPAVRSEQLVAGGAPVKFRRFGKDYVAYRGASGKVGILDARCPHRGASMELARNEDDCLRCLFHGWKFDADGKCVDVPNERSERAGFREAIKMGHYAAVEAAHTVWAYLGEQETPPPFPAFRFNSLPLSNCLSYYGPLNCNWLQGVEPALDNSHATVLHSDVNKMFATGHLAQAQHDRAPKYDVDVQPYGIRAAASRRMPDGNSYVRVIEYVAPFYFFVPSEPNGDKVMLVITPVDDTHSMQWFFIFNENETLSYDGPQRKGFDARWWVLGPNFAKVNRNNFREGRSPENMWGQNRAEMMTDESFAGLYPLCIEDLAIQESQGAITDRVNEHLGAADMAVSRLRRFMLDALRNHQAGALPPGQDGSVNFDEIVGSSYILSDGDDWRKHFEAGSGGRTVVETALA